MGAALHRSPWPARLAVLLITGLIFLGCLVLVALPLAWLWVLSHLRLAYTEIYVLALLGCPAAIVGWGWVLIRLNRVYVDAAEDPRPVLEASITLAVLVAVAALTVWAIFIAESGGPTRGPWPS